MKRVLHLQPIAEPQLDPTCQHSSAHTWQGQLLMCESVEVRRCNTAVWEFGWAATFGVCSFLPTKSAFMVLSASRFRTSFTCSPLHVAPRWKILLEPYLMQDIGITSSSSRCTSPHCSRIFALCRAYEIPHLTCNTDISSALHRASK